MSGICYLFVGTLFGFSVILPAQPLEIRIGGLFESSESVRAFQDAISRINSNRSLLPRSPLTAMVEMVTGNGSFQVAKNVCALMEKGVSATVGPSSPSKYSIAKSTSSALHIPHLQTSIDFWPLATNYSINLFPFITVLSRAFRDLIVAKEWKSFTIIYEESEALITLQEVLTMSKTGDVKILLTPYRPINTYRKLLKDISRRGETNLVLDLPPEKIPYVLREAQGVGMMTEYHNFILTTLDMHMADLQDFQLVRANITGFRLIDSSAYSKEKPNLFGDITEYGRMFKQPRLPKTEAALLHDAVYLLAKAFHDTERKRSSQPPSVSCKKRHPWSQGELLVNYMKTVSFKGITGEVNFDSDGYRRNFSLDIVELKPGGLKKIGTWTPIAGVNFSRDYGTVLKETLLSLKNKTLRITSLVTQPYVMLKQSDKKLLGNDQFEGYCIDLVFELSKLLGFKYEFHLVRDRHHGASNDKKEWTGMIRELIDREADMAVGDLTITYERDVVVDFTTPFMNLGVSILFRKPTKKYPKLFSFLQPLSAEVWVYMAIAYLGISVLLFILARFSPYEWVSPHPCDPDSEILENQFSLLNSLWFTIGSLMQQGSDLNPKALSTRVVAGIWWFFTLIMISSYTANLAAFLTAERMKSPIDSVEDLANQNKIQYGCVESGSTRNFFKESKLPTYRKMFGVMENNPSVYATTNQDGKERVLKGDYAFLMESVSIEYLAERNCELTQIGGLLDTKGYGIATPAGSPYTTLLSSAILKLQETGKLHNLKVKWWKKKGGGLCVEDEKKTSTSTNELGLANVGGVFVVLLAGLGSACVIVVIEFIAHTRKKPREERVSLPREMIKELRRAIVNQSNVKSKENHKRIFKDKSWEAHSDSSSMLTDYELPNIAYRR
uniref:Glutamate receptor 1 n=1 Tax=Hadrurus spadix TaxID=141984 RepID=A0A1W7RAA1_9SCOR